MNTRIVIDYSGINHLIVWPGQVTPSCDEVLRKMGEGNKYFMALDFSSGFWQIPISKESRPVTAFVTECGKFVWNVLPQGMRSSLDYFLRITDEALRKGGLTNYVKHFDDLLLFAKSMK